MDGQSVWLMDIRYLEFRSFAVQFAEIILPKQARVKFICVIGPIF